MWACKVFVHVGLSSAVSYGRSTPGQGNTGGLGGAFGICEALGVKPPFPTYLLHTPVQNFARLRESVFGKK